MTNQLRVITRTSVSRNYDYEHLKILIEPTESRLKQMSQFRIVKNDNQ